jgi:hypothetical protein
MQFFSTWRSLLAATAIFLLLSGSYELAGHWPGGEPVSVTPATRRAPAAVRRSPPVPLPTDAQLGYHRYVGTIGGRPVLAETTLELQENPYPDTLLHAKWDGTFYYRATGLGDWLGQASRFRADQSLETNYQKVVGQSSSPLAVLCADQPPGPVLTGWYTPPGQRQALPISLRESYADGVRYELLYEESYGPAEPTAQRDGTLDSASVAQHYLHLLGSDTLRPALARLQCLWPAARRRARRRRLHYRRYDYYQDDILVTLNEGSLLAYTRYEVRGAYGSRYDQEGRHSYVLDLRTGRPLSLATQLRPGGWQQVQRLLTHRALADAAARHWVQAGRLPLPPGGFELTPTGWVATYSEPQYEEDYYTYTVTLDWATLRPLLRAGSPLRRLLKWRRLP